MATEQEVCSVFLTPSDKEWDCRRPRKRSTLNQYLYFNKSVLVKLFGRTTLNRCWTLIFMLRSILAAFS